MKILSVILIYRKTPALQNFAQAMVVAILPQHSCIKYRSDIRSLKVMKNHFTSAWFRAND